MKRQGFASIVLASETSDRPSSIVIRLLLACCLFAAAAGCTVETSQAPGGTAIRPDTWANPLAGVGLDNFYQVSPTLYRGAQPTAEGFRTLADLGVKKIINLRHYHDDAELLAGTGLLYTWIKMDAHDPEGEEYTRFLLELCKPGETPIFVHCKHGADRTGTAVALYRTQIQEWDVEEAVTEMEEGGYGHHAFFGELPKLIRTYNPVDYGIDSFVEPDE